MSELDALAQLAVVISSITVPAPLKNVWVYPTDIQNINFSAYPIGIVSMQVGTPATIGQKIACEYWYEWAAEILIVLTKGPLSYPGVAGAYAESLQFRWPQAVAAQLMTNPTLNGTSAMVGEVGEGVPVLTVRHSHIEWNQNLYWGLIMTTRVAQSVEIL